MGRELQKRKGRSSRPTVRQPSSHKKPMNPTGNSIIAKNWNKKETLAQNYRRLGLVAKLGRRAGGVEPDLKNPGIGAGGASAAAARDPFAVRPLAARMVTEARVERDASGKIVRVVHEGEDDEAVNPLRDPLRRFDSDYEGAGRAGGGGGNAPAVVRELERLAGRPTEKTARHQSRGEAEWLERLVRRHGDDTAAMARDRKLNPMQQTEADIVKRLRKWRAASGKGQA